MKKSSKASSSSPLVFLSAGEASGDLIGMYLMRALKALYPEVRFMGIGGPRMIQEGLTSLFPMEKLSLLGIFEIIPKALEVLKLVNKTVDQIKQAQPDLLVTIDNPAFNFRVGKRLKKSLEPHCSIAHVHYGAPTVWAWRPKRAQKCAQFLDHLLTLFPFEPPYFEREGLSTTFVGHPIVEEDQKDSTDHDPRTQGDEDGSLPQICLLPGSRLSEIKRLLPIFLETLNLLYERIGPFRVKLPTFSALRPIIDEIMSQMPCSFYLEVVEGGDAKKRVFKESTVALAASGTVALELACFGVPCVVGYKVNRLSAWIVKYMIKIPYVSMPNILLNRSVIFEGIQQRCTPAILCQELERLLRNPAARQAQKKAFLDAVALLHPSEGAPSAMAAKTLQHLLISKKTSQKGAKK